MGWGAAEAGGGVGKGLARGRGRADFVVGKTSPASQWRVEGGQSRETL